MAELKRVLLTGGTGFVGANLTRRLVRDGHEVHLIVRPTYAAWRLAGISNAVHLHMVDLTDADDVARVVGVVRPEWVFHLAAYGAYSSQTDVRRIMQTNVVGTVNLLEACLPVGFEAFVNAGSSSEYGLKDHPPHEDECVEPNSHYAVAKVSATLYCRHTAQSRGVHLPTLRLYSVYGPYEEPTRLMPTLIARGIKGAFPPLVRPDIARDYVYAEDVTDAFLLAATCQGQELGAIYNVGTGIQTSLRQVVGVVQETFGIIAEPAWGSMPDRGWDTTIWIADNARIRAALGWEPQYNFSEGFRAMVQWFIDHPELERVYARD